MGHSAPVLAMHYAAANAPSCYRENPRGGEIFLFTLDGESPANFHAGAEVHDISGTTFDFGTIRAILRRIVPVNTVF